MEKYSTFRQRQQDIVNKFPIGAAFSKEQQVQMMHRWGLEDTPEDRAKVIYIGAGCFVQKKDYKAMQDMFAAIEKERAEYLAQDEGYRDALEYEFGNHECQISNEWTEGLEALGMTWEELTEHQRKMFFEVRAAYFQKCIENDWF